MCCAPEALTSSNTAGVIFLVVLSEAFLTGSKTEAGKMVRNVLSTWRAGIDTRSRQGQEDGCAGSRIEIAVDISCIAERLISQSHEFSDYLVCCAT